MGDYHDQHDTSNEPAALYDWESVKKEDYSSIIDGAIMSEPTAPCEWNTFKKRITAIMSEPAAPWEWDMFKKKDYSSIIDVAIIGTISVSI